MKNALFAIAIAAALSTMSGQDIERRADPGRGAGPGGPEGCNVAVDVDGSAEIEIRGDHASLHNLSGQTPHFRLFECSRPVPPNARDFRFTAQSGRGKMEMVREPREDGPLVVRIEDPQSGAGEYRFHIAWGGERPGERRDRDRDADRGDAGYAQERERFFEGEGWRRNLFQRVREDVDHVAHATIPFTGDRARLTRTIARLNDLQDELSKGHYDERGLDEVMRSLRAVVEENRLSGRDHDTLSDDLRRLSVFRERHDEYGARSPRY